jgi:hypothetical protein
MYVCTYFVYVIGKHIDIVTRLNCITYRRLFLSVSGKKAKKATSLLRNSYGNTGWVRHKSSFLMFRSLEDRLKLWRSQAPPAVVL